MRLEDFLSSYLSQILDILEDAYHSEALARLTSFLATGHSSIFHTSSPSVEFKIRVRPKLKNLNWQ